MRLIVWGVLTVVMLLILGSDLPTLERLVWAAFVGFAGAAVLEEPSRRK
jgi:hypothetical protein